MQLLSHANPKTQKSVEHGYLTFILHLAPHTSAGMTTVCPGASPGCIAACLNLAGRGGMMAAGQTTNRVQIARINRTQFLLKYPDAFMDQLAVEINSAIATATRAGLIPCFRLNGTSDLRWRKLTIPSMGGLNVFDAFPTVQFYDYTAVLDSASLTFSNYHLTFSQKENNSAQVAKAMLMGMNIATVFDIGKRDALPANHLGRPVISFDDHDLRFLDPVGVVGGLRIKGWGKIVNAARSYNFAIPIQPV